MTDAAPLRSLNCPNCGAPLTFPEGQTSVRCRFCDSTLERSVADLTDDDDAHVIQIDASGLQASAGAAGPARRFVVKMRNGEPVVIEIGKPPAPAPTTAEMYDASRAAAAAAARRRAAALAQPAKRSSNYGCLVAVVAVLIVAGLIAWVSYANTPQAGLIVQQLLDGHFDQALATSRTVGSNLLLTGSGVLIPGPNDGPDQAILLSVQYPSERPTEYRLIAVDTAERRLLWLSAVLDPELYSTRILADDDRVYVLSGLSLVAFNRTDGTLAWAAPLADRVSLNTCRDCLQLVAGHLAALSDDGTLDVFDAATGQSQWQAAAVQDAPRGLYVVGGRLAFMDRDEGVHGVLRTFDPATGDEESVQPVCGSSESGEDYSDWTTPLLPAPDGSVYLAFGSNPACLQRWETDPLTLAWSTLLPDDFYSSLDGLAPTLTGDTLYLGSGHEVVAVSTAQGEVLTLVHDEDYVFAVEAVHGADLVLRAERTRGSTRYALWDVDAADGAARWTFDLADNPPVEPAGMIDDNTPEWLAQPTAAGLRLLRFQSDPDGRSHAVLNEMLDWQTGQSGGQTKTILRLPTIIFDAPSWTVWKGDTLWMVIENDLLAFDAAGSKVISRWP